MFPRKQAFTIDTSFIMIVASLQLVVLGSLASAEALPLFYTQFNYTKKGITKASPYPQMSELT